jgi:hypothetical protein
MKPGLFEGLRGVLSFKPETQASLLFYLMLFDTSSGLGSAQFGQNLKESSYSFSHFGHFIIAPQVALQLVPALRQDTGYRQPQVCTLSWLEYACGLFAALAPVFVLFYGEPRQNKH